jgi:murein DD-endopeptidase MepM/ murein hydrolase activator NlpD
MEYLFETAIIISCFYVFYELFLKRDTWFGFNRFFLLFGVVFSLLVPLLDFSASVDLVHSKNQFEFNEYLYIGNTVNNLKEKTVESVSHVNFIFLIYLLISGLYLLRFVYQFYKIIKIIPANEIINDKNKKIVFLKDNTAPFSFFNYIFISKDDYGLNDLLQHEFVHAQQKHSLDIILLELILVFQWFNPFMYRYRRAFKEIHEYLADQGVMKVNHDKIAYQKLILDQIEKSFKVNLASHFNYSLTKNRIKMMTRINSSRTAKLKLILIVPFTVFLLSAFTIETAPEKVFNTVQLQTIEKSTKVPSIFPVKKINGVKISSGFGMRMHPIYKIIRMHNAVDIVAPKRTLVLATADGMIRKVKQNHREGKGYGMYIIIDHERGYSTLYAQLSGYNVKEGVVVKQGDIIGYVGSSGISTGPHLHYEVMKDGENVNTEDYF